MASSFTTFKRTHIVEQAEQLQATLVGVLAAIQERAQETVDTLGQHTATPRASQQVAQGIPGFPESLLKEWRPA